MLKNIVIFLVIVLVMFTFPMTTYAIPERGDVIAEVSFGLENSPNTQNARIAAQMINGKILQPGEEFSFNRTTGPRTLEKGFILGDFPYRLSDGSIVHGKEVASGVCRISTALFGLALNAHFPITERSAHDIPVGYVPAGRDATVNYDPNSWYDLRFVNDRTYPVKILISIDEKNRVLGQLIRAN